jgi:hypothetical protein
MEEGDYEAFRKKIAKIVARYPEQAKQYSKKIEPFHFQEIAASLGRQMTRTQITQCHVFSCGLD